MAYFPQLVTGAAGQFPGERRTLRRTVVNEAPDGRMLKLADSMASAIEWGLELKGLTDEEWTAIEELFEAVEGRLETFVFLDPFDNLLKWSEDLSAAVWAKDAGLALTEGLADPFGGTGATGVSNTSAGAAAVSQSVNAPGWYCYAVSVYARSAVPTQATLFQRAGSESASSAFEIGPAWRRVEYGAQFTNSGESVEFGASVAPGATVELFGFQAEPQVRASGYKKTTSRNGVYGSASFAEDALARTTSGLNNNSCKLRIRAVS